MNTYIYIYIHTYIHIYMYMYMYRCNLVGFASAAARDSIVSDISCTHTAH